MVKMPIKLHTTCLSVRLFTLSSTYFDTSLLCAAEGAEATEGAPSALGYISAEATVRSHPRYPLSPMGRHKDDVHAVGVMGVLFLSTER